MKQIVILIAVLACNTELVIAQQSGQWLIGEWVVSKIYDRNGKFSYCAAGTTGEDAIFSISVHSGGSWFIRLTSQKLSPRNNTPYTLHYSVDRSALFGMLAFSFNDKSLTAKIEPSSNFVDYLQKGNSLALYFEGAAYVFNLTNSAEVIKKIRLCRATEQTVLSNTLRDLEQAHSVLSKVLPSTNLMNIDIKSPEEVQLVCPGCSAMWFAGPYGGSLELVSKGIFSGLDHISAEHVAQAAKKCPGKFGSRRVDASSETSDALILTVACEKDGVFEPGVYVFVRGKSGLFYVFWIRSIGGTRNSDETLERLGFDLTRAVLHYDANKEN